MSTACSTCIRRKYMVVCRVLRTHVHKGGACIQPFICCGRTSISEQNSGHTASEECSGCQVTSMARISCTHHILGIKHLLSELRDCESTVLLRSTRSQRSEACHEEMQAWERDQVHSNLAKITIQLPWEAEAASHTTHRGTHEVIKITICGCCQLQCPETDIIKCLVV